MCSDLIYCILKLLEIDSWIFLKLHIHTCIRNPCPTAERAQSMPTYLHLTSPGVHASTHLQK